jgi:hypothetical protein
MDFVIQLLMGAGIAAGVGIRPFLPVLLVGALANTGIGFHGGFNVEGTDFAFLDSWTFLLIVLVGVVILDLVARRGGKLVFESGKPMVILAIVSVGLGALEASGSMAAHNSLAVALAVGIPVGGLCAALGFVVMRRILTRAKQRLDRQAQGALPLYAEGSGMISCGASILFAPLGAVIVGFLLWLFLGERRRSGEKYAGLRVLR